MFERAWIAGVAGSAAAWITTPFDVGKTRIMLEAGGKNGGGKMNAFRVGKEVLHREVVRGLFRGGSIRGAALTIVGNRLYMGCYEAAKLYLTKKDIY